MTVISGDSTAHSSTSNTTEHVSFEVNGSVAVLELRRPEKRNALSRSMWEAIIVHLETASRRTDISALVVQGTGGSFCAGADLGEVKTADGTASDSFHQLAVRALRSIAEFPAPSVARIEGACIGGGCSIALACDLRFARPNAFFSIPAVRHGIMYDEDSVNRLVDLMGSSRAGRFLYTAEKVEATRALQLGLIDECVDSLDELVADFAGKVAKGDMATIAATRRMVRGIETRQATLAG